MYVDSAIGAMKRAGLDSVLDGSGGRVTGQLPAAGAEMNEGALVMLYVDSATLAEQGGQVAVPDVAGMPVMEANRLLHAYGLEMRVTGSGLAVEQSPSPGEQVNPTTLVTVRFEPP